MNSKERRKNIIDRLENAESPISATRLANEFSVTRQIIVADVALLRASGLMIRSEHKGYVLDKATKQEDVRRIVVNHDKSYVEDELYAIVDHGGKVLDVIVEHTVYGKISAELNLSSRYDVDRFVQKITETGANPLSLLTEGLHIHTIVIKDEDSFQAIIARLASLNILIEYA